MRECAGCGEAVGSSFRFCPWCGRAQRRKLVEFFRSHPEIDDGGKALRVSRYLDERHVRFSVWNEAGVAEAAVSITEAEAERLRRFLEPRPPARLLERLRDALKA